MRLINEITGSDNAPTRNDYAILAELYNGQCTTELRAYTIAHLRDKTNLSMNKVRRSIEIFKGIGYVQEGIKSGRAKTYYITIAGINRIDSII